MRMIPAFLLCLTIVACTMTSAEEKGIQLLMDSTSYAVNSLALLEIRNFTDAPLYLKGCTSIYPVYALWREQDDGTRREAYRIPCVAGIGSTRTIPVESAIRIQIRLRVDAGRGVDPTGDYRLWVQMHRNPGVSDAPLDSMLTSTAPFRLRGM